MSLFFFLPLYYQLLSAYQPSNNPQSTITSTSSQLVSGALRRPAQSDDNLKSEIYTTTIAVLGDSMIDTLGLDIPQLQTAISKYFPQKKVKILNYGVGASNIEYALYRLTNNYEYLGKKYDSLISQNPDIIIIESFAYNNFGNSQSGIDKQWLNLGSITTIIKSKLPQTKIILAATIAPNSITFGNGIVNTNFTALDKIEQTNTIKLYLQNLINFATSKKYPLADAYHLSLINNEGNPDFINTTDYLHPSTLGGEFFCDTIAKTIFDNQLL